MTDNINIKFDPRAKTVTTTGDTLTITLADGRALSQPLAWTPRLAQATAEQRADYVLHNDGAVVLWLDIDVDIIVEHALSPFGVDAPPPQQAVQMNRDDVSALVRQVIADNAEALQRLADM